MGRSRSAQNVQAREGRAKRSTEPAELFLVSLFLRPKATMMSREMHLTRPDEVSAKALEKIATEFGGQLEKLSISLDYDEDEKADVGSVLSKLKFPSLESLSLSCCMAKELRLWDSEYPSLLKLELSNMIGQVDFDLNLPKLNRFFAEHTHVADGEMFAKSWSRCVSLESIGCYKLWGLSSGFIMASLPNCTALGLHRSDDLQQLLIYAPKLEELNLQACYGLDTFKIIDTPITPEQVMSVHAFSVPLQACKSFMCTELHHSH